MAGFRFRELWILAGLACLVLALGSCGAGSAAGGGDAGGDSGGGGGGANSGVEASEEMLDEQMIDEGASGSGPLVEIGEFQPGRSSVVGGRRLSGERRGRGRFGVAG